MSTTISGKLRTIKWFGAFFLLSTFFFACGKSLSDQRAIELVRLNYRQQSTTEGAGTWLIDTVEIYKMTKLKDSVPSFAVTAFTRGLYKLPIIEDAPAGYTEKFFDTVQFVARQFNKVWLADDWVIIGSKHE